MKCNACWKDLEGKAVATTCGHIFCTEDSQRILSSVDATCPLCEQMLSESKTKAVDIAPTDEWINLTLSQSFVAHLRESIPARGFDNVKPARVLLTTALCRRVFEYLMVMAGVAPQSIMKSAFKGVVFWIGQKDVEVQLSVNKAVQFRQKCEQVQADYSQKMSQLEEAYNSKLQQVHAGYQKAMKRIKDLEHEKEVMQRDKKEVQEKYTEKSRQKRKLEEMYDALRKEHETLKRSVSSSTPNSQAVIQQRPNPYAFAPTFNGFDDMRHLPSASVSGMPTNSQAGTADFWPTHQEGPMLRPRRQSLGNNLPRPVTGGSPTMFNTSNHQSPFNTSSGAQPSDTFRNLLRSPSTRPRGRPRGL